MGVGGAGIRAVVGGGVWGRMLGVHRRGGVLAVMRQLCVCGDWGGDWCGVWWRGLERGGGLSGCWWG